MIATIGTSDLASSWDRFTHAAETFFHHLTEIGWGYFAIALALWLALQLARAHAWANALRAPYPRGRVSEPGIIASFLVGAGMNSVLPARGGDALKIVLGKRSIEGSSYPTIISSFAVLAPFDAVMGFSVLLYAITQGLLPRAPDIPRLPAFEISYWASHLESLLFLLTVLGIVGIALFAFLARRVEAFWLRLKEGVMIFSQPTRYLRQVAAWQLVGWLCRFWAFWLFLDAFGVGGSFENVLLVLSVQSITGALPFTPGGVGAQQALLVATLSGVPHTTVLSYSVGQQLATTAWSLAIALAALLIFFRTSDWRRLVREGGAARAEAGSR